MKDRSGYSRGTVLSIWDRARILMSGDPASEPLAIMTIFGATGGDPLVLVAGFLGSVAQWREYEADWSALLDGCGLLLPRPLDAMIEALRALPSTRRLALVRDMGGLMTKHGLFGRGAFIRAADFAAVAGLLGDDSVDARCEICAIACLEQLSALCASYFNRRRLTIAFKNQEQELNFLRLYEHLARETASNPAGALQMNNLMFYSEARSIATRAVDVLAYMIFASCIHEEEGAEVGDSSRPDRDSLPIRVIEIDDAAIVASATWVRALPPR